MKNETDDEYKKNLTDDVMLLQKKLKENADINITPDSGDFTLVRH